MVYTSEYEAGRVEDSSEREDGIGFTIWTSNEIQKIEKIGEETPRESSQQNRLIEGSIVVTLTSTMRVSMNISLNLNYFPRASVVSH
jgi:hypothetical protein